MLGLLDSALTRMVRKGRLTVIDANGDTHHYGNGEPAELAATVRIQDDKAERAIVLDPALGASEALMDGRMEIIEGDIMKVAALVKGGNPFESKKPVDISKLGQKIKRNIVQSRRQANHRKASKANVAHHYDLDDRLYDRFLDPWRQYSCAYWRDDTPDLAAAQRAKIAHIVAKLDIAPDHRVLDIGCGWGGMAIAIHKLTGAEVMGITLSKEQLAYAREWAKREGVQDKVRFELVDYRDIKGPFDRIVSVGMFEHVGTRDFPAFFLKCRELLTEEGVALIHTIGRIGGPGSTDAFTRKYIFPGGYIPALSEVVPASEGARLILTDCEILRVHYGTTLRAWYKACVEQQAEIEEIYDAKFFRMWSFYLAGATQAFETGGMVNFQLQFARNRYTLPLTRDYMMVQESVYREQLDRWAKA